MVKFTESEYNVLSHLLLFPKSMSHISAWMGHWQPQWTGCLVLSAHGWTRAITTFQIMADEKLIVFLSFFQVVVIIGSFSAMALAKAQTLSWLYLTNCLCLAQWNDHQNTKTLDSSSSSVVRYLCELEQAFSLSVLRFSFLSKSVEQDDGLKTLTITKFVLVPSMGALRLLEVKGHSYKLPVMGENKCLWLRWALSIWGIGQPSSFILPNPFLMFHIKRTKICACRIS